ncbi:DUF2125 domain-containing protein [Jannaschia aquimarina]|uniref:DUF2125 domain-containing protein n=1 Tax=Jannaschia aquimarina TaxID=935700 RepID=A0A0D1CPL0_9RHOB|nr:DUF2125 domain-containing protein [Jannaschia aquimarina]KIT16697.1 hypothetical protein jaqu_14850 [Jannaschia aquimarina]SNS54824.1 hypothetical protein SAMN05421775_101393 [Jannaschia aquimarina]
MSKYYAALPLALLAASPAWSLTAPELWEDWQEMGARLGMELQVGSEDYSVGRLVLEDVQAVMDFGGGASTSNYGTLTFVEQNDGSVRIEIPPVSDASSTSTLEGETVTISAEIRHEGLSIIARDEGDQRIYDIRADSLTYEMGDITGDEVAESFPATMTLRNLDSTYQSDLDGEEIGFSQTYAASAVDFSAAGASATGETFDLSYAMSGLGGRIDGTYPSEAAPDGSNIFAMMGITYEGEITHSGSTLALVSDTPEGQLQVNGQAASGGIELGLDEQSITYLLTSNDAQMTVVPPAMPLPINVTMAEARTGVTFPYAVSEGGSPWALDLAYRDLALDEQLWALFDPTGQLPRDPATLVLTITGEAEVLADFLGDPEAVTALEGPPIRPESLDLSELRFSVAGAELTGTGALTFPETPAPFPMPVGRLNLALDGGMALLDKLVAMGLVPAQQATFVRGMAGMVARPVGENRLESEIEFTEGGGILANGLPLQ